jgi:hypothetical protein
VLDSTFNKPSKGRDCTLIRHHFLAPDKNSLLRWIPSVLAVHADLAGLARLDALELWTDSIIAANISLDADIFEDTIDLLPFGSTHS